MSAIRNLKTKYWLHSFRKSGPIWTMALSEADRKYSQIYSCMEINGTVKICDPDDPWAVLHES